MVSINHIARRNRQHNSGGRYPDALKHATTMAIMLRKLAKESSKDRPAMTIVALHLWLTQQWPNIRSSEDIPDFERISGSTICRKNTFRTYYDGSYTWTEYAHGYQDGESTHYLWHPLPPHFNAFFQPFISGQSYETPFLRPKVKNRLFLLMNQNWKTPPSLSHLPRVRKDSFHRYLINCALVDNTLSAIPRAQIVTNNRNHHKHAERYQRIDSDRVRYKLFDAQHRYITRLIQAARSANLSTHFDVFHENHATNLIADRTRLARYLTSSGRIAQYVLDTSNNVKQTIRSPAIKIGSKRYLDENEVVHFFDLLFNYVEKLAPKKSAKKNLWINYFQAATYRVALLFILLTGARPTHGISILGKYYAGGNIVFIKDKGRLRQLIVCDYLKREIQHYRELQAKVLSKFSISNNLEELWYCIDDSGRTFRLSNRALRQFMNQLWPGVIPYQLRHFFAQSAVNDLSSARLLDQDVDRIMGHESIGEHLGRDVVFPFTVNTIKTYLNHYATRLSLKEFIYV